MQPKITDISQIDLGKTYTYADYLTWRLNERVELIKGWIYTMSPAPKRVHQKVEGKLFLRIGNYFEKKNCEVYQSPFDVRLIKNIDQSDKEISTVVQPDISVICDSNKLDDRGCIGAPDLIVEVLSTSTMKKDYSEKFNLYQENEVREYWLVNPDAKSVQIYSLEGEEFQEYDTLEDIHETITSKIFPELSFPMIDVFEYN